jgi:hypothetical protein
MSNTILSTPFNPQQAYDYKETVLPPIVVHVVNTFLSRDIGNRGYGRVIIYHDELIAEVIKLSKEISANTGNNEEITKEEFFKKNYAGMIVTVFQKYGWNISVDYPGYNESYRSHIVFESTAKHAR